MRCQLILLSSRLKQLNRFCSSSSIVPTEPSYQQLWNVKSVKWWLSGSSWAAPRPPVTRWSSMSERDKALIDLRLSVPISFAGCELGHTRCCALACLWHSSVKASALSSWPPIRALSWDSNETLAPQWPGATLQFPLTQTWCLNDLFLLEAASACMDYSTKGTLCYLKHSQLDVLLGQSYL